MERFQYVLCIIGDRRCFSYVLRILQVLRLCRFKILLSIDLHNLRDRKTMYYVL